MNIISTRGPVSWTGHEIQPGELGLVNHGGVPEVILKTGRYPRFPLRWVIIHEFRNIPVGLTTRFAIGCGGREPSKGKRDSRTLSSTSKASPSSRSRRIKRLSSAIRRIRCSS